MVWYGMVWYGMVWYGMVWYGMIWYGMVWYGIVDVYEGLLALKRPGRLRTVSLRRHRGTVNVLPATILQTRLLSAMTAYGCVVAWFRSLAACIYVLCPELRMSGGAMGCESKLYSAIYTTQRTYHLEPHPHFLYIYWMVFNLCGRLLMAKICGRNKRFFITGRNTSTTGRRNSSCTVYCARVYTSRACARTLEGTGT